MRKRRADKGATGSRQFILVFATALTMILCGAAFVMMRLRFSHMHAIFFLLLCLSILLATYLVLWKMSRHERLSRLGAVLLRCFYVLLAIGISSFLLLQGLIISGARSGERTGARSGESEIDVLIVLGAGLNNNAPSLILASRLDAAIEFLQTSGQVPVIVTGGLGRGEIITEAQAMFSYLSARGVAESLIWKEDASTNTRENLAFSLELIESKGLDTQNITVGVLSNEFHLYRATVIAGKAGLDAVGVAAPTPGLHRRVIYQMREALALAAELLNLQY